MTEILLEHECGCLYEYTLHEGMSLSVDYKHFCDKHLSLISDSLKMEREHEINEFINKLNKQ